MILVADDHALVAESIAERLRTAGHEVSVAGTRDDILTAAMLPNVALLVLDLRLWKHDGLDLLGELRPSRPSLPVILLTGFDSGEVHQRAETLGVLAVLGKTERLSTLVALVDNLVAKPPGGRASIALPGLRLSAAKLRVLELVASGLRTAAIASEMKVATKTAEEAVGWLMHRLGAKNRAHLVAEAIRHGFLRPPPAAPACRKA